MKLLTILSGAAIVLGSAAAVAQTSPDGSTANEKPGQGTNTGSSATATKYNKMMGPSSGGASSGTSTGSGEAGTPAKPGMAPQPPPSGKGVPDSK